MEFSEVLQQRQSIRSFEDRELTDQQINEILDMANTSLSAGNLQARSVIIIRNKEIKKRLVDASFGQDFVAEASVVFVITANAVESAKKYGQRGKDLYALQDATIFTAYLQLAVTAKGLASVWVGAFDEDLAARVLSLNKNFRPIAIIPVGYPAGEPRNTERKSLDELVIKKI